MTKLIKLKTCEFLKVSQPDGSFRIDAKVSADDGWDELIEACFTGEFFKFECGIATFEGSISSVREENGEMKAIVLVNGKINLKD